MLKQAHLNSRVESLAKNQSKTLKDSKLVLKFNANNEVIDFEVVNVEVVDYDDHGKLYRGGDKYYDDTKWYSIYDNTSLIWQNCCDRFFYSC